MHCTLKHVTPIHHPEGCFRNRSYAAWMTSRTTATRDALIASNLPRWPPNPRKGGWLCLSSLLAFPRTQTGFGSLSGGFPSPLDALLCNVYVSWLRFSTTTICTIFTLICAWVFTEINIKHDTHRQHKIRLLSISVVVVIAKMCSYHTHRCNHSKIFQLWEISLGLQLPKIDSPIFFAQQTMHFVPGRRLSLYPTLAEI